MSSWKMVPGSRFEREYRKLDSQIKERVTSALTYLKLKTDPRTCGDHKIGDLNCLYTYEIGRRFRILYEIRFEQKIILLERVGLHKIYD